MRLPLRPVSSVEGSPSPLIRNRRAGHGPEPRAQAALRRQKESPAGSQVAGPSSSVAPTSLCLEVVCEVFPASLRTYPGEVWPLRCGHGFRVRSRGPRDGVRLPSAAGWRKHASHGEVDSKSQRSGLPRDSGDSACAICAPSHAAQRQTTGSRPVVSPLLQSSHGRLVGRHRRVLAAPARG